jgi:hypothetical protein
MIDNRAPDIHLQLNTNSVDLNNNDRGYNEFTDITNGLKPNRWSKFVSLLRKFSRL